MPDSYKDFILNEFKNRQTLGTLPPNLQELTPGNIRLECLRMYKLRYKPLDDEILNLFFDYSQKDESFYASIDNSLAKKYKQVPRILKGEIEGPSLRYLELIAWMLDLQPRPMSKWLQVAKEDPAIKKKKRQNDSHWWLLNRRKISLSVIFACLLLMAGWLVKIRIDKTSGNREIRSLIGMQPAYMYWLKDHFEPVDKDKDIGETLKLALDEERMRDFRKILRKDTITYASIGKLWYSKIDNEVEFFTSFGRHPIHIDRKLKKVTKTIIDNYANNE